MARKFFFIVALFWAAMGVYWVAQDPGSFMLSLWMNPFRTLMAVAISFGPALWLFVGIKRENKKIKCDYSLDDLYFSHDLIEIRSNKPLGTVKVEAGEFRYEGSPSELSFCYVKGSEIKVLMPAVTGTTSSGETFTGTGGTPYVFDSETGFTAVTIRGPGNETKITLKNSVAEKLQLITNKISSWGRDVSFQEYTKREEEKKLAAQQKAEEVAKKAATQAAEYLKDWGIQGVNSYCHYYYSNDGQITEMLAALPDGKGGAVYNSGKNYWTGSWKNAVVSEVDNALEIQVDDQVYRGKYLKEHRITIPPNWERKTRLEWCDRIRILSSQAQA